MVFIYKNCHILQYILIYNEFSLSLNNREILKTYLHIFKEKWRNCNLIQVAVILMCNTGLLL